MFLTMKRLMALSLGTITPEASQRTRRTCTNQQQPQSSTTAAAALDDHTVMPAGPKPLCSQTYQAPAMLVASACKAKHVCK
jgi:hypothetical protein